MIVERISSSIATYLHENAEDKKKFSYGVMYYGSQIIINFMLVFILLVILSLLLHIFTETMILFIMVAALRQVSGGMHIKSSELCTVFSVVSIILVVEISKMTNVQYLDYASLILLAICAPATFKIRLNRRKKAFYVMKIISLIIVLINIFFLKINAVSVAFIVQSASVVYEYYKLKKSEGAI